LADEDFNRVIVRGVLRSRPDIDIVRVQDVGLRTQDDDAVLDWAAANGRVLLTHDEQTMPAHTYERILNALPMPGVFVVQQEESISRIIEEIIILAECSLEGEWEGQVNYLPLK
jgi:hypothetical protein